MSANPEDGLWILLVGLLVLALWLPHLYYAFRKWQAERTPRSFRNAFIAAMLIIGLTRGVLAGAARLWPGYDWIQIANRGAAPIIFVVLITGAIVAWWTWRHDGGRWA